MQKLKFSIVAVHYSLGKIFLQRLSNALVLTQSIIITLLYLHQMRKCVCVCYVCVLCVCACVHGCVIFKHLILVLLGYGICVI